MSFVRELRGSECRLTIVEAHEPNVETLREVMPEEEIIHADIREWAPPKKYDLVVWWHGPEHVNSPEVKPMLEKLEAAVVGTLLIGCPWGDYKQGEIDGNPFERHLCPLSVAYFRKKGFRVTHMGEPCEGDAKQGGQIVASKCL